MKIMTKIMLFLLSISHMGKAWVPVHTSNLYVSEVTDSYSYNEETRYDNDFTADETYYNSHREKMDDWKKKIDCYAGRQ